MASGHVSMKYGFQVKRLLSAELYSILQSANMNELLAFFSGWNAGHATAFSSANLYMRVLWILR